MQRRLCTQIVSQGLECLLVNHIIYKSIEATHQNTANQVSIHQWDAFKQQPEAAGYQNLSTMAPKLIA